MNCPLDAHCSTTESPFQMLSVTQLSHTSRCPLSHSWTIPPDAPCSLAESLQMFTAAQLRHQQVLTVAQLSHYPDVYCSTVKPPPEAHCGTAELFSRYSLSHSWATPRCSLWQPETPSDKHSLSKECFTLVLCVSVFVRKWYKMFTHRSSWMDGGQKTLCRRGNLLFFFFLHGKWTQGFELKSPGVRARILPSESSC